MTRSREGALVNLTPGDPQDVYQEVAERLKDRIEHDRSNATKRLFAEKCLAWIWDENAPARPRKTVKTNVMTYFYGSNVSGMTDQQLDGPLEKLEMEERELEELADTLRLPLSFAQARMKIAKYIAQHVHATIEEVVKEPAKVKKLLGKLARSLGDEGIPLRWTSPSGFPWVNRYQEPVVEQIRLIFRSIGIRTRVSAATGEHKPGIDVRRAGQGAPPNFVHACDAAHLMLTVNAAVAEGITSIATVHDSFGCLASRATRFRQIIREEFLRMYKEHDVLAEILEQASADLTDTTKLPRLPEKGKLDIEGVLEAEYAFA
jgi:DNA-directed RNA polymerase